MRSPTESASSLRVLMRMPDLSAGAGPAKPAIEASRVSQASGREVETFVQTPLAPLATPAKDVPKASRKLLKEGVMPEELQSPGKFARPLTVLAILAVAAAVGVALTHRKRDQAPAPAPATMEQVVVDLPSSVPGGSPTEITQIPEMRFPTVPESPVDDQLKIERLPTVGPTNTAGVAADGATAQVSDTGNSTSDLARQPGVASLERSIEQPKPQATHDSSRQGLY